MSLCLHTLGAVFRKGRGEWDAMLSPDTNSPGKKLLGNSVGFLSNVWYWAAIVFSLLLTLLLLTLLFWFVADIDISLHSRPLMKNSRKALLVFVRTYTWITFYHHSWDEEQTAGKAKRIEFALPSRTTTYLLGLISLGEGRNVTSGGWDKVTLPKQSQENSNVLDEISYL